MRRGFTIFELVIVIAIVAILAVGVITILNPAQLYAKGRNTARLSHLNSILNAVGENIADNRGTFSCSSGPIPATSTRMSNSAYNIAPCLAPAYLSSLPYDPSATGAHYASTTDYDTGYTILKDAASGRITVAAPSAELNQAISVTR